MNPDPPLGSRADHRPGDAGKTLLGAFGDLPAAAVDRGGAVTVADESWSVDWHIGAEDRWHFPNVEAAVRQTRLGPGPVIETAVRIPGGDCVQRVWATRAAQEIVTVIEVENQTATPVALALGIRDGQADATGVRRDGYRLVPERTANDVFPELGAVVVPLPHGTAFRTMLSPLKVAGLIDVKALPDAAATQRGWASIVESGASVQLPDSGLTEQFDAARARILLQAHNLANDLREFGDHSAHVFSALAIGGYSQETMHVVNELDGWSVAGAKPPAVPSGLTVAALGTALALHGHNNPSGQPLDQVADGLLELSLMLTQVASRAKSSGILPEAEAGLARVAVLAGQTDAAFSAHSGGGLPLIQGSDIPATLAGVAQVGELAGESRSWQNDQADLAARFVLGVRNLLVTESAEGVDLLPNFPAAWRGGSLEVKGLATAHGRCSYAIRWHGYRPALLWEFEPHPSRTPPVLRCSTLDPTWETTDLKGEVLLAGTSQDLGDAPRQGDSFG